MREEGRRVTIQAATVKVVEYVIVWFMTWLETPASPHIARRRLCAFPATWIDEIQLLGEQQAGLHLIGYLRARLLVRILSLIVFPLAATIDVFRHSLDALKEYLLACASASRGEARKCHLEAAKACGSSALRCFLGVLGTPAGFRKPDSITHHFIPFNYKARNDTKHTVRPFGDLYKAEADIRTPKTIEEIRQIVREARRVGKKIAIAGARFSQGKSILPPTPNDIMLDLKRLNHVDVRSEAKVASVGAGATWESIQKEINTYGLAVKTMQASNLFSIGGSIAINCHGWNVRSGAIGNTLKSLTLVDSNGDLRTVDRSDELFRLVVGGMGLFGVIVSVDLELVENAVMERYGDIISVDDYLDYFDDLARDDSVDMHIGCLSVDPNNLFKEVLAENYRYKASSVNERIRNTPLKTPQQTRNFERILLQHTRQKSYIRWLLWEQRKSDVAGRVKEASRNEHMVFPIQAMFNGSVSQADWLQEYFVPRKQLSVVLRKLRDILFVNRVPVYNASIRYVPPDFSSDLSYAHGKEMFAIVLCFAQSLSAEEVDNTESWIKQAVDLVLEHGGTFYLPYVQFPTKTQFLQGYPHWKSVAWKKRQYDPWNVFDSGFRQTYVTIFGQYSPLAGKLDQAGEGGALPQRFLYNVPVQLDNRPHSPGRELTVSESLYHYIFRSPNLRTKIAKFLDVIFLQADSIPFLTLMDNVLKYAITSKDVYTEVLRRIDEARPGGLKRNLRAIKALSAQTKAIGDQFRRCFPDDSSFEGYIEVESAGRFIKEMKKHHSINGPVMIVNDASSIMDYIEAGVPLPYEKRVPLDDYTLLDLQHLEESSVDLISCYRGLHHVPPHKLDAFIQSIRRVLRHKGVFLLREHDANSEDMVRYVDMVHSVFNVASGAPWEEEKNEVRNFHSVSYWKTLLARHGFEYKPSGFVRDRDPTENTLLAFEKVVTNRGELEIGRIRNELRGQEGYATVANQICTEFEVPEWQNVEASTDYAETIHRVPFYEYPYVEHLCKYWELFNKAYQRARKYHSFLEVVTCYKFGMGIFVGVSMSLSCLISAAVAWLVSQFLAWSDGRPDPVDLLISDPQDEACQVDPRVQIIKAYADVFVKRIRARQCQELLDFVRSVTYQSDQIRLWEIGGSSTCQIRLKLPRTSSLESLETIPSLQLLFTWTVVSRANQLGAQVRVRVADLPSTIRALDASHIEIGFIHGT